MKVSHPSHTASRFCGIEPFKLRPCFSFQELAETCRALMLGPRACWQILKYDSKTSNQVFEHYVFFLAAIPCVAGFIGHGLIGRTDLSLAFTRSLTGYVFCVAFFFGAVTLARRSANLFDGEIAPERAAKLVVYSLMPLYLCSIALLLPASSPLALLGTVSAFYFLRGVRDMSRVPVRKQLTYGILNVVCWIVAADVMIRFLFSS